MNTEFFSKKTINYIKAVSPIVAECLVGPLYSFALSGLSIKLLNTPNGTMDDVEKIILEHPEDLPFKLKELNEEFIQKLDKLGINVEKLNKKSDVHRYLSVNDYMQIFLAVVINLGFFAIIGYLLIFGIKNERDSIMIMLGAVQTAQAAIVGYYFGSSSGSERKTEILNRKFKE